MTEKDRHVYMIMAHHRPDLLQLLIESLDDVRNDIVVHIDLKSKMDENIFATKHAKLFFTDRMNVNWAGYTQVEAEYVLLKKAIEVGCHKYYHFLTGVNYPLWNQDYIHDYFNKVEGYEFIGFDYDSDYSLRAKYYVPFSEYGKLSGVKGKLIQIIRFISKRVQDALRIDRRKKTNWKIKKGCAYFSITEDLAYEVLEQEEKVKKIFSKTISADEHFVQCIAYNSSFKSHIYDLENEFDGCLRDLAWPDHVGPGHDGCNFNLSDLDYLLASKRLFAMKFESSDGIELIKKIKEARNIS